MRNLSATEALAFDQARYLALSFRDISAVTSTSAKGSAASASESLLAPPPPPPLLLLEPGELIGDSIDERPPAPEDGGSCKKAESARDDDDSGVTEVLVAVAVPARSMPPARAATTNGSLSALPSVLVVALVPSAEAPVSLLALLMKPSAAHTDG